MITSFPGGRRYGEPLLVQRGPGRTRGTVRRVTPSGTPVPDATSVAMTAAPRVGRRRCVAAAGRGGGFATSVDRGGRRPSSPRSPCSGWSTASARSSRRWPTTSAPARARRPSCSRSPRPGTSRSGCSPGRIADRVGPRPVLLAGAVALGLGLFATSRVTSIWLGYVTYGVGVGTAVACAYVPMVATVGGWFARRRTAALGVSVAGIGMGTLVMAPLSESLIDRYGWRTADVVLAIGGMQPVTGRQPGGAEAPLAAHQEPRLDPSRRARPWLHRRLRRQRARVARAVRPLRVHQELRRGPWHRLRRGGDPGRCHRRSERRRAARSRRGGQPVRSAARDASELRHHGLQLRAVARRRQQPRRARRCSRS